MKNILICVSGLSPQIITETFYSLSVKKNIIIDEIYLITTQKGKNILIGKDKEYNKERQYPPLIKELKKLCKQYKLKFPKFDQSEQHIITGKLQSTELYDIRNDKHNRLFPNLLCRLIKEKTSERENVLHCSVSGGRKTMSVDLALALTLFGRHDDKIYHVLVDENLEYKSDFWFPENTNEAKLLEMSEIPYVKLRPLIENNIQADLFSKKNYTDMVDYAQKIMEIRTGNRLYIDKRRNELRFSDNPSAKILPRHLEVYEFIIFNKKSGRKFTEMKELTGRFFGEKRTDLKTNILSYITKINSSIALAVNDPTITQFFRIEGPKQYGRGNYGVFAETDDVVFMS